jgi:hypothetical protein
MRIGGPFTYGQPSIPVQLAGGEVFYPPAGNYQCSLGAQTVVQFFDPVQLAWRIMSTPFGSDPFDLSTDGYSWRLLNASGVVQGAQITNAGTTAVNGIGTAATGVSVSFGAAPASGVAAAAYPVVGGSINTTIAITQAGSGFVVPPILIIDPPPAGGIQATATCTISAGAINAVTVTNAGAGYTAAPQIYVMPQYGTYPGIGVPVNPAGAPASIIPPGLVGSNQPPWFPGINWPLTLGTGGALLTINPVLTGSGTLTGIVMTNWGLGYAGTTIPTITVTGAGAAAATALMSMALQSITITSGGVAYPSGTSQIWDSSLGMVAATTNIINNNTVGPRCARGVAANSGTVINSTIIEDAGFGFQKVPLLAVTQTQGVAATTVAQLTAVVGGVTDTSIFQPAVQQ